MAGAGYKLFQTGDVLTAAQVNTYLNEQTVMVFASSAARTSALSSVLAEGMVSYLMDTNAVEVYDGAAWVGVATGDITAVTAGTGISGGGTSGAVTITNSMATEITAAGDIIVGTGSGTFDNLPIGTTGQVLTADTTVSPYKVKWATAAASTPTFVGCSVTHSTTQSINNATETAVVFNTEAFDTDGFHSTSSNTSRMTIPSGKNGKYLLSGSIAWTDNATGVRYVVVYKNGSYAAYCGLTSAASAQNTIIPFSYVASAVATDYFEVYAYQSSGGALNLTTLCNFQISYLGA